MTHVTARAQILKVAIDARKAFFADQGPTTHRALKAAEHRAQAVGIPWQEIVDGANQA